MARPRTSRARRKPLSRERVLRAAIGLADAEGIEALSMRKLARELGVEAMSLYNHVANKDAILDGIVEVVAAEAELPAEGTEWKSAIRQSAIATRDMFVRHPWASGLWMSRQGGGTARLRRADWLLRRFREAGLSEELTFHAYHVVESHILGFTVQQLNFPYQGAELEERASRFLARFPVDEFPDFADHVRQHLEPHEGGEGGFELGLDLILDGLERLRDAA
jgi:AcrR family transcriptional regulator